MITSEHDIIMKGLQYMLDYGLVSPKEYDELTNRMIGWKNKKIKEGV